MRRLLTLVFLFCLAIPAGISISGCTRNPGENYCNGEGFGPKKTDLTSITLQPQVAGISMFYGQTQQVQSPTPKTCLGTIASVSTFNYGTTNNQLVDISPTGNICAGTWNRNSGGGIANYTICTPPTGLTATSSPNYSQAFITASAGGITSNPVEVYVHPQVTAISIGLYDTATGTIPNNSCLSQTQQAQIEATAYYTLPDSPGKQLLCAPNSSSAPSCSAVIGQLQYTPSTASIATIDQYGVVTANLPGTTIVTASVSQSGSSAGTVSTCPPAHITVSLNGSDSGSVTQGVTQNLTTTITDTAGATITGLTLNYQSTNPIDIAAGQSGNITANFAGEASIYAVCQPTTCNPAPDEYIGQYQTGLPVTSNPVTITTPGTASAYMWLASPDSQYFIPIALNSGTVGSTVKLPYFPNSMVMDRTGNNLYFGSSRELMVYTTATNTLTKEDPNVPGVVLAVAPDNSKLLINDPIRQVFYIYTPSGGAYTSFAGVGTAAEWTPDAQTLYIAGQGVLYVYNVNTGWSTYPLSTTGTSPDLAITIPGVGAYISGTTTVARTWCPIVVPGDASDNVNYPQGDSVPVQTDALGATTDGQHILGAAIVNGAAALADIGVTITPGACPANNTALTIPHTLNQATLPISAGAINQVVVSPASNLAFITYEPSGTASPAVLPYYIPGSGGNVGTVGSVQLVGSPTGAKVGVFNPDNTQFFVSTEGDNLLHYINVKTLKDVQQVSPGLLDKNGNLVPAAWIAVKPRATT